MASQKILKEVLDDDNKEIFMQHFSSAERPKQQNSLNQENKGTSENSQSKQGNLGSPIETRTIDEDKEEEDALMDDATSPSLTSPDQSNASTRVSFAKDVNEPPQRKSVLRTSRKTLKTPPSQAVQETEVDEGILHPRAQVPQSKTDKPIILKKGLTRPHIHRYTLRIKTNNPRTDDDEQQQVQATLQKFWETVLQADSKTIIPPYLELDRGDKNVFDISFFPCIKKILLPHVF